MDPSPPPPGRAPHLSPDEFRALGHRAIDWIADYWSRVERLPVRSRAEPGGVLRQLPEHPPERGLESADAWDAVFGDLDNIVVPGLTHWQSPNFFAYFPANASAPGVLGELLSAGLGVQGMLWQTSPACTELEIRVLDWLARAVNLPAGFLSASPNGGGVIQGTASEAALVALVAARDRVRRSGRRADPPMTIYTSDQAHSSIVKAAMIAGLADGPGDRSHVRLIATDASGAMKPDELGRAVREDLNAGLVPTFVAATIGTTGTTAIDAVDRVADDLDAAGFRGWLHIDAAHAGALGLCPEFAWMFRGLERADSYCFNPHKWLLTNFDCNCFWTRDRRALIDALSVTPEYLRNAATESGSVTDFRDWQVPLGRRFRALKLWLVMRHYGLDGLRAHVREHVRLAAVFEGLVRGDARFEISAPRTMNLVCFRLRGEGPESDARNRALMDRLNASGSLYLTHTALPAAAGGRVTLRMAIGAVQTQERHVRAAWELIARTAGEIG